MIETFGEPDVSVVSAATCRGARNGERQESKPRQQREQQKFAVRQKNVIGIKASPVSLTEKTRALNAKVSNCFLNRVYQAQC
ncbi:MAG: hypothetical protein LBT35_05840 [Tannerella sp.]|jgi:hypothetical protein|nr:hypothetical protein [Tannerella sp.]